LRRNPANIHSSTPSGSGDLETRQAELLGSSEMPGSRLVHLPVHDGAAPIELLHPVAAHVARAGLRVTGDYLRQRDERPPVARPACQNGQRVQVDIVPCVYDLLAGSARNGVGRNVREFGQLACKLRQGPAARREPHLDQFGQGTRVFFEVVDAKRQRHARSGPEGID
jgi:hypothetical protein